MSDSDQALGLPDHTEAAATIGGFDRRCVRRRMLAAYVEIRMLCGVFGACRVPLQ